MNLMTAVSKTEVPARGLAVCWLGQAGFLLKTSEDKLIVIDPYLSDCVEREFGFKRLSPTVVKAEELRTDILIVTHEHLDHLDIDSMPILGRNTKETAICSVAAANMLKSLCPESLRISTLSCGQETEAESIKVRAVYADHGELAPDSIGVLLDIAGYKVYYSSDTSFRPEEISGSLGCEPDLAILPINGMYGNMNGPEAAELTEVIKAGKVIPSHYWMFKEHSGENGDPSSFEAAMNSRNLTEKIIFLTPGEIKIIAKEV